MQGVDLENPPARTAARGRYLIPLAVLVTLPVVAGIAGWLAGWPLGVDTAVYRAGALTVLDGRPLYESAVVSFTPDWAPLPFTYPPAAALLFLPLALFPIAVGWGLTGALSVLAIALMIRLAVRDAGGAAPARWVASPWSLVVPATVVAVLLEPVWRTISLGQVNLLLVAMVMLDVLVISARGTRWGGVLIGVASAVKLTPLIFVAHLLFTGRWRDALRALGTFVLLQGLAWLVLPSDTARYWNHAVSDPARIGPIDWSVNQSLNGLMLRVTGGASWSLTAALGIGVLLAVPAVWLMWRFHRSGQPLGALLVTAFYGLLISPVSWSHHYVWVVPLLALLVLRAADLTDRVLLGVLLVIFGSYVLLLLPGGRDPSLGWSPVDHVLGNAYLLVVVALTLLITVRVRSRGGRA